jgi:hypothetical protein
MPVSCSLDPLPALCKGWAEGSLRTNQETLYRLILAGFEASLLPYLREISRSASVGVTAPYTSLSHLGRASFLFQSCSANQTFRRPSFFPCYMGNFYLGYFSFAVWRSIGQQPPTEGAIEEGSRIGNNKNWVTFFEFRLFVGVQRNPVVRMNGFFVTNTQNSSAFSPISRSCLVIVLAHFRSFFIPAECF